MVEDVREAPDRPGRELVFVASRPDESLARPQGARAGASSASSTRPCSGARSTRTAGTPRVLDIIEPAYLAAETPQGQSGRSGDAAGWEHARRLLLDAVPDGSDVLDIGCANGLLMESLVAWAAEDGQALEPYGVEISARLADLARARLPHWADRIWTGNAMTWVPPRRFDVVRTGLDYVPPRRRADFVGAAARTRWWPLAAASSSASSTRRRTGDTVADTLRSWGHAVAGATSRAHRDPRLRYKAVWVDASIRA